MTFWTAFKDMDFRGPLLNSWKQILRDVTQWDNDQRQWPKVDPPATKWGYSDKGQPNRRKREMTNFYIPEKN